MVKSFLPRAMRGRSSAALPLAAVYRIVGRRQNTGCLSGAFSGMLDESIYQRVGSSCDGSCIRGGACAGAVSVSEPPGKDHRPDRAGGSYDLVGRIMADALSKRTG